jgi:hypothetical protein
MKSKPDLTAKETLLSLLDQADHDEAMERVLARSPKEMEERLAAAGLDPAEQRKKGEAMQEELRLRVAKDGASAAPEREGRVSIEGVAVRVSLPPASKRGARPRWLAPLATAATVAAAGASVAIGIVHVGSNNAADAGNPTDDASAATLRKEGLRACEAKQWETCKGLLDRAAALDPSGEQDPQVVEARRRMSEREVPPGEAPEGSMPTQAPPGDRGPGDKVPPK